MKKPILIVLMTLFLLPLAVTGCANKSPNRIVIPKDAAKMTVAFTWEDVLACSHDSPEIIVDDIPQYAISLQVQLKNITVPEWNQGGGEVENDGSGRIPPQALDIGYNGPCPPLGERHKYEFWVMALDVDGEIIGFGKARQSFPPKQ